MVKLALTGMALGDEVKNTETASAADMWEIRLKYNKVWCQISFLCKSFPISLSQNWQQLAVLGCVGTVELQWLEHL